MVLPAAHGDQPGSEHAVGGGVPGVDAAGGYREGTIPGTNQGPDLRLI